MATTSVSVTADTGNLERVMRVLAEHLTACADELALLRIATATEQAARER